MSAGPARALNPRPWLLGASLGLLSLGAWVALVVWHVSPHGHYMHLEPLGRGEVCRADPAGLRAGLYMAGWVLMTVAMMLPTTLPLVAVFLRLVRGRPERRRLLALLVAGYLLVWGGFGGLAYGADRLAHGLVAGWPWLWSHAWVVGAATLALAGAYQFSALKYRCLDACRSPLAFAVARWQPAAPASSAWRLGFSHGLYCVGCCWALMLLMFGVGLGSLGWMLGLAVVMAIEKNLPGGRRLGPPLGAALLMAAAAVAGLQLWA